MTCENQKMQITLSKKQLLFILICFSFLSSGQNKKAVKSYEEDFIIKAANSDMTTIQLNDFFVKHQNMIFPKQGMPELMLTSKKKLNPEYFPLLTFKNSTAYKKNIKKLLYSENDSQRVMAYITIGSSADTSYDAIILGRLKTETKQICLMWAAMSLFYHLNKSTEELLDLLVTPNFFGDFSYINLFRHIDAKKLRATCWKNINSENNKKQALSLQTLAYTDKSAKVDSLVISCLKTWDNEINGFALDALLQRDNIQKFAILEPLLANETTRKTLIKALEDSKFQSDRDQIAKLKKEKNWN